MLVLSRKKTESIFINDNVVVKVLKVSGNKVVLGVEAPMGVPVHRKEVYEKIRGQEVPTTDAEEAEGTPR